MSIAMILINSIRANKNMQNIKPFSRSLKKFIAKTNPEQREVTLYFERSASAQKLSQATLPVLPQNDRAFSLVKRKTHSHKIQTEPTEPQTQIEFQAQIQTHKRKPSTLQEHVDDIMYGLIGKGQATVECSKQMREKLDQKKFKNLRVVTQEPQKRNKKRKALQEHLESIIQVGQTQPQKVKKRYIYQNPHIQKKINTRWQPNQSKGLSKQTLPYYPLVDLRQQNQQILMNIPATTDEYLRRLRQTVFYKGPKR